MLFSAIGIPISVIFMVKYLHFVYVRFTKPDKCLCKVTTQDINITSNFGVSLLA